MNSGAGGAHLLSPSPVGCVLRKVGIKNRIKGVQFGAVNGERIAKCLMCTPLPQHNIADAQVAQCGQQRG